MAKRARCECASLRAPPAPPTRQGAPPDQPLPPAPRAAHISAFSPFSNLQAPARRRWRRPDRPAAARRTARGAARPDAERRRTRATAGAARGARDASSDHEEREDGVELGHFDLPRRRRNGTHAWSARARVRRSARHQHECGSPTFKRVPAAAGSAIVGYFSRSGAPARTASTRSRRRARARRHELRALRSGLLPTRRSVPPATGGYRKVTDVHTRTRRMSSNSGEGRALDGGARATAGFLRRKPKVLAASCSSPPRTPAQPWKRCAVRASF